MSISYLFILSLLVFLSQPFLSHSVRCHTEDRKVLLKIREAFTNPGNLATWEPSSDCCYWYGVLCDHKTNRIIRFFLSSDEADVSGQIPEIISQLSYLDMIGFDRMPNLTGTIPHSLTRLTRLTLLRISFTNISGPIPSYVGEFKALTSLDLSYNNLSGSIPPSLGQLTNLYELRLDGNKLVGAIPESFENLTNIEDLYLAHNQLSGTIPRGWGNLNFSLIGLQNNQIVGDISSLFGKNKTLYRLDFSRNKLQFNISNVEFPDRLRSVDLNHNNIVGSLATLRNLVYLNVSYNRLCGRIPAGNLWEECDYTSFFHNKCLCGAPLPDCK